MVLTNACESLLPSEHPLPVKEYCIGCGCSSVMVVVSSVGDRVSPMLDTDVQSGLGLILC